MLKILSKRARARALPFRRPLYLAHSCLPFCFGIFALIASMTASLGAASATSVLTSDLRPATVQEIVAAIISGRPLVRRLIAGKDLAAALSDYIRPDTKCADGPKLGIENSVVQGEFSLWGTNSEDQASVAADDVTEQAKKRSERTLTIPIAIQDTTLDGQVSIKNLEFGCYVEFKRSKFEDQFSVDSVIFSAGFDATGATFSESFSAISVDWRNSVSFRKASFLALVSFTGRRTTRTRFAGTTDFQQAVFNRGMTFIECDLIGHSDFSLARIFGIANFSGTNIGAGPEKRIIGPFYMTEFSDQANFRNADFKNLKFVKTIFKQGVDFHGSHGKALQFWGVTINGRANFSDIQHLEGIQFWGFNTFTTIENDIIFRRSTIGDLSFRGVILKKNVDLEETKLLYGLSFQTVSFEGSIHLEDAILPPKPTIDQDGTSRPRLLLEDVTMNGGLYADADQLLDKPAIWQIWREATPVFAYRHPSDLDIEDADTPPESRPERRLWRELRHAFDGSGNIELKNYAEYQLRLLEESDQQQPARTWSYLSRWFWGYGVRPFRVVSWAFVLVGVFAGLYFTQLSTSGKLLVRAKYAIVFSVRTALELWYGYERSATTTFRVITLLESFIGKVLLVCFAYSLTQTSPLLSELLKKLIP